MSTTSTAGGAARRELAGSFDGEPISPEDGGFDEARKLTRVFGRPMGDYERLAKAKASYDPSNTFQINQNIKPAS